MAGNGMRQFLLRLRHNHKPIAIWDVTSASEAQKRLAKSAYPDKYELLEDLRFSIQEWDEIVDLVIDNMPERNWKISRELRQRIWLMSQ